MGMECYGKHDVYRGYQYMKTFEILYNENRK